MKKCIGTFAVLVSIVMLLLPLVASAEIMCTARNL